MNSNETKIELQEKDRKNILKVNENIKAIINENMNKNKNVNNGNKNVIINVKSDEDDNENENEDGNEDVNENNDNSNVNSSTESYSSDQNESEEFSQYAFDEIDGKRRKGGRKQRRKQKRTAENGRSSAEEAAANEIAPGHANSYAGNKNMAEGLMDIALLSANANQLRFLITYNSQAPTYFISLGLVILSLVIQIGIGVLLIYKRRIKPQNTKRFSHTNAFILGGVFIVTVVNVLLAALTTTDDAVIRKKEKN